VPHPFLILTTIRSGSTHLTRLLNAHPNVVCNGEVFNHSDPDYNWPGYPPTSTEAMIQAAFVDYPTRGGPKDDVHRVGCKLEDLSLFGEPTRLGQLLGLPGMRCLVLVRRNQFECFRSMLQAWETDNWSLEAGADRTPLPAVTIPPPTAAAFFNRAQNFYGKLHLLIPPAQALWIDYDDLGANQGPVLAQVWHHLGVPAHKVDASLSKLEERPLSETVANYDELQLLFEKSEYGGFLP
jgi:LPS sulfotransferase NodH